jgi:hypothetical protein
VHDVQLGEIVVLCNVPITVGATHRHRQEESRSVLLKGVISDSFQKVDPYEGKIQASIHGCHLDAF